MAASEPPDRTASNKEPVVSERRAAVLEEYLSWLEGRPLAARSRQAYAHQVRRYLAWLADRSPVDGDPLTDEDARDWAVRDYKRHLKAVELEACFGEPGARGARLVLHAASLGSFPCAPERAPAKRIARFVAVLGNRG